MTSPGQQAILERTVLYVERNVLRIAVYPVANPGLSAEAMLRRLSEP